MSISSELSDSLLILIEGNQNGCAVVAYRSAFTWLAIMSSTPPPPNSLSCCFRTFTTRA